MQDIFGLQAGADAVAEEGGIVGRIARTDRCAAAKHLRVGIAGRKQAAVEIFRPFPNQPVHIINAPVVRAAFADIVQAFPSAVRVPIKNSAVVAGFV